MNINYIIKLIMTPEQKVFRITDLVKKIGSYKKDIEIEEYCADVIKFHTRE